VFLFDMRAEKGVSFKSKQEVTCGNSDLNELSISDNFISTTNDDGEIFITSDFSEKFQKMEGIHTNVCFSFFLFRKSWRSQWQIGLCIRSRKRRKEIWLFHLDLICICLYTTSGPKDSWKILILMKRFKRVLRES